MATKKYYRITSRETKKGIKYYIYIDDTVKPTAQDLADIQMYIKCGYEIKHKSEQRAKEAKARANVLPKKAEIIEALKNDKTVLPEGSASLRKGETALEHFNSIENFFEARSWYLNEYLVIKNALEKENSEE